MNWKMFAVLLGISAIAAAATGIGQLNTAVSDLCCQLMSLLPVVAMLMIVIAGVIYAAGQMMGAETRARANVWATAALTGALIAVLIFAIAPSVLNSIWGGSTAIDQDICVCT
ncbi:MAG: hypothetical protein WC588_04280 [Candidatus Micrarchaeia archaeon]